MKFLASQTVLTLASAVSLSAATVITTSPVTANAQEAATFSPFVDEAGQIALATDFRTAWVHLGTYFVADNEHARGPGIHDVYAEPDAVERYLESGEWPDGAALVKEIRSIETEAMTTGTASFAGELAVWFVMIKDRLGRFPDNPIWGAGWGWALYMPEDRSTNVNENWQEGDLSNCYACHLPAEETDWVFIEGYPTLR